MDKLATIEKIERRTFLKGRFKGKYFGILDEKKSDLKSENFYQLVLTKCEIKTNKSALIRWNEITDEHIDMHQNGASVKVPYEILCEVYNDGFSPQSYRLHLTDARIHNPKLYHQTYEGQDVFGSIEGEISGFLLHKEEIRKVSIINDAELLVQKDKEASATVSLENNHLTTSNFNLWSIIGHILGWVFLAWLLISLLTAGWQIILPVIFVIGIVLLFVLFRIVFAFIFRAASYFMLAATGIILIGNIVSALSTGSAVPKIQSADKWHEREVSDSRPNPELIEDSIIQHNRIWNDYEGNQYEGVVSISRAAFSDSEKYRTQLDHHLKQTRDYNTIIDSITSFEAYRLHGLNHLFDSLNNTLNFSRTHFAEVMVSFVQDIPYTLILGEQCDPNLYNDAFISSYLKRGGPCIGNIKYGFYSPTEFMYTLLGDCDTRTILLYTLLGNYGYDVAIFNSTQYKHSILGINLPYEGTAKVVGNTRYILWETTQVGFRPGVIPREIGNLNYWEVSLLNYKPSI